MNQIVLNQFGEKITFDSSFALPEDDTPLKDAALVHGACHEPASVRRATDTHNGIFCSFCGRIPDPAYIPKEIDTCGKLRIWCDINVSFPSLSEDSKLSRWREQLRRRAPLQGEKADDAVSV